jgi:hypothetical protein
VPEHRGDPVQAGVDVLVTALDEAVGVEQNDPSAGHVNRVGVPVESPDADAGQTVPCQRVGVPSEAISNGGR